MHAPEPKKPRAANGWDGKLRLNKEESPEETPEETNGAASPAEESEHEEAQQVSHEGEQIDADEGIIPVPFDNAKTLSLTLAFSSDLLDGVPEDETVSQCALRWEASVHQSYAHSDQRI